MDVVDLVKLNLDDMEDALENGAFSAAELQQALELEVAGKNRSGAIELINDAMPEEESDLEDETSQEEDPEPEEDAPVKYAVAKGVAVTFRAGMKSDGDLIDINWPEYAGNEKLLAEHLEKGLIVKL